MRTLLALARAVKAKITAKVDSINKTPTAREIEMARKLQFLAAAPSALDALRKGDLESLGAQEQGGQVWINARIRKEDLARLLGTDKLRVIMPSERLAHLIMTLAHEEDHRLNPTDIMA